MENALLNKIGWSNYYGWDVPVNNIDYVDNQFKDSENLNIQLEIGFEKSMPATASCNHKDKASCNVPKT